MDADGCSISNFCHRGSEALQITKSPKQAIHINHETPCPTEMMCLLLVVAPKWCQNKSSNFDPLDCLDGHG